MGMLVKQGIGEHPKHWPDPEHVAPQTPRRLSLRLRAYRFIPLTEHHFCLRYPHFSLANEFMNSMNERRTHPHGLK